MSEALKEVPGYPDEAPMADVWTLAIPKIAAKAASLLLVAAVAPWAGRLAEATYTPEHEVAESATEFGVYSVGIYNVKGEKSAVAAKYSTKEGAGKKEKLAALVSRALGLEAAANLEFTAGGILCFEFAGTEAKEDKGGLLSLKLFREVKKTPTEQPGV